MNKILLSSLLAAASVVPAIAGVDNVNYQAVIKNGDNVVANQKVEMKFEFVNGSTVVYSQELTPTTNDAGFVSCVLGGDEAFNEIDWNGVNLRVSVNLSNGYQVISNEPVSSVPSALRSNDAQMMLPVVEELAMDNESTKAQLRSITADMTRFDDFINDVDGFNDRVSEELSKLMGLDAEELGDFNQRVSDELGRLGEEVENNTEYIDDVKGNVQRVETQFSALVGQVGELNEAVEGLSLDSEETKTALLQVNAHIAQFDGFIEEQDAYNQSVSDAIAKMVGLDAEEIGDFNQRVSDAIARLNDTTENLPELQEAVEGLIQQNEDSKETLNGINAHLAQFDGFIVDQEKTNDEIYELLKAAGAPVEDTKDLHEAINNQLDELTTEVEGLVQDNENTKETLKNLSADVARLDGFIDDVDGFNQRVSEELNKLIGLDAEELGDFNQRVSDELSRLADEVENNTDYIDEVKGSVMRVETNFSPLVGQVGELNDAVEGINTDIADVQATLRGVNAHIAQFDGFIEEQATFNQSVSDELAKMVGLDADEINEFNQSVSDELARLGEEVEGIKDSSSNMADMIDAQITKTNNNLSALEKEVEGIQESCSTMATNFANQIDKTNNNLGVVDTNVEKLQKNVVELQEAVQAIVNPSDPDSMINAMSERMAQMEEEFNAQIEELKKQIEALQK